MVLQHACVSFNLFGFESIETMSTAGGITLLVLLLLCPTCEHVNDLRFAYKKVEFIFKTGLSSVIILPKRSWIPYW